MGPGGRASAGPGGGMGKTAEAGAITRATGPFRWDGGGWARTGAPGSWNPRGIPGDARPGIGPGAAAGTALQASAMRLRPPLLVPALSLALSCAASRGPVQPPAPAWESPLLQHHPLVGRVWRPDAGQWTSVDAWLAASQGAGAFLLGEKHDNPDHHRLEARVLEELVGRGLRPTLAVEMLETDRQPAVDAYLALPGASAAGFGAALTWDQSGWPPWPQYRPIFEVAFRAGLPVRAANLPRATARALVTLGIAALPDEAWRDLALDRDLPPGQGAALREQLRQSHCGHLPEELLAPMALAQRVRDATMAQRVLEAPAPVVLVAGAGHVRTDRGVPWYLRARRPGFRAATLAFIEVEAGRTDPRAYAEDRGGAQPFDAVWFTPRANDDDPCGAFKRRRMNP